MWGGGPSCQTHSLSRGLQDCSSIEDKHTNTLAVTNETGNGDQNQDHSFSDTTDADSLDEEQ